MQHKSSLFTFFLHFWRFSRLDERYSLGETPFSARASKETSPRGAKRQSVSLPLRGRWHFCLQKCRRGIVPYNKNEIHPEGNPSGWALIQLFLDTEVESDFLFLFFEENIAQIVVTGSQNVLVLKIKKIYNRCNIIFHCFNLLSNYFARAAYFLRISIRAAEGVAIMPSSIASSVFRA